jgi:hypothetical protein
MLNTSSHGVLSSDVRRRDSRNLTDREAARNLIGSYVP